MEILKSKHFRNGITAEPFDAGVVLQQGTEYLVVQFDEKHTAAFKMIDGKVNFAESMRGDYFSDTFKVLLENERKVVHTAACLEYNMKYEHDTPGECICLGS